MVDHLVEGTYTGDVIAEEFSPNYNRVKGTIIASQTVKIGSLTVDSSGSFAVAGATQGANVNGIALADVTTGSGETNPCPILNRGPAIVLEDGLDFGTMNESNRNAAKAALLALGIKVVPTVHA